MGLFALKNCCFFVPPRFGCMIISLIDTLWSSLNFYLCMWVLMDSLKSFCLMQPYFTDVPDDYTEMKLAAIGAASAVMTFICAILLFMATRDDSKRNFLVLVYIAKNASVIGVNIYFLVRLFLENNLEQVKEKNLFAVGASVFDIVVPLYFGIIALFFYLGDEDDDDDESSVEKDTIGLRKNKPKPKKIKKSKKGKKNAGMAKPEEPAGDGHQDEEDPTEAKEEVPDEKKP